MCMKIHLISVKPASLTCSGFADRLAGTIERAFCVLVKVPLPVVTRARRRRFAEIVLFYWACARIEDGLGSVALTDRTQYAVWTAGLGMMLDHICFCRGCGFELGPATTN